MYHIKWLWILGICWKFSKKSLLLVFVDCLWNPFFLQGELDISQKSKMKLGQLNKGDKWLSIDDITNKIDNGQK